MKYTRIKHEYYLNELGIPDQLKKSNGGIISNHSKYGTWLRNNDKTSFNESFEKINSFLNELSFKCYFNGITIHCSNESIVKRSTDFVKDLKEEGFEGQNVFANEYGYIFKSDENISYHAYVISQDNEDSNLTFSEAIDFLTDLFKNPALIPADVKALLDNSDADDYMSLEALKIDCESLGYTFDYTLEAEPYGLRKIRTFHNVYTDEIVQVPDFVKNTKKALTDFINYIND